jgi:hypothetical protein|tara:strand:- start:685 stop:1443 length:759 start_codon:yes stop_codon:yes gene_type:complete
MSLVLAVVSADIEAALAPVDVCIAVNLVPKDSVALTFAVVVSSTNASPAPLVAPSSDRVVVIAVSPAILWLDSLVNKVSKPVPENDPARMSLIAEALAVDSARISVANPSVIEVADVALAAIVAVRPLAVDKMSAARESVTVVALVALAAIVAARPLVTEVALVALSVIDVARPSVTEVILVALSVIVVARPSVTAVIVAALATMAAAEVASLVAIAAAEVASLVAMAAVVLALTLVPPLSANVLVVSAASF